MNTVNRVSVSIRLSLFLMIVAINTALVGGLIYYNHLQNTKIAIAAAYDMMAKTGETVQKRSQLLIRPPADFTRFMPAWTAIDQKPTASGHPAKAEMLTAVKGFDQNASSYIGYDDGSFYQLYKLDSLGETQRANGNIPAAAVYAERIVLPGAEGQAIEHTVFLAENGNVLGRAARPTDYDPRQRPWYTIAVSAPGGKMVQTGIYEFRVSGVPGVTFSRRMGRQILALDVTLKGIARQMAGDPLAQSGGFIALYDNSGTALAASRPAADRRAKHFFFAENRRQNAQGIIRLDGQDWIYNFGQVDIGVAGDTFMATALPKTQVLAPLQRIAKRNAAISALCLLLSIPIIWLITKPVSRSLTALAQQADQIRKLDFSAPDLPPSHVAEVSLLQNAMQRMRQGLQTFNLYVPTELVPILIDSKKLPELGGDRRELSIFFSDIENFTSITENLPPEQFMALMTEYFETVTAALRREGAMIDKFIGDAIMALWNAPNLQEDHVHRMCRGALAAARASDALYRRSGKLGLRTCIGLHVGPATIGNVGSAERMNYTAMGKHVNIAARVESINRKYGTAILATAAVYEAAKDSFTFRHIDTVSLKGFSRAEEIYELIGEA